MKTIRFILGICLVSLALWGCSKSEDPTPPAEPEPPAEKTFIDTNETAEEAALREEFLEAEEPPYGVCHNFFRVQNDSDHTLWWDIKFMFTGGYIQYYLRPGEQATHLITMNYTAFTDPNFVLMQSFKDMGLEWIEFFVNAPTQEEMKEISKYRSLDKDLDTLAKYEFYDGIYPVNYPLATPKDYTQWTFEKITDHRVRWTYRFTNEDRWEAVRQTLERWKDKPAQ